MPIFQASLTTSYNSTESAILVSDASNYTTNTQSSHALAEFDASSYYRLKILKPDSSTFVWSNLSGADITIPSASVDVFDGAHVLLPTDVSGDYAVSLVTVPTWDIAETYNAADNDYVYHASFLWQCVAAAVTTEPTIGSLDWTLVSESSLDAKYTQSQVLAVTKSVATSGLGFSSTFVESDGTLGVSVSSNCSSIQIDDNSNYINGSVGHAQSDFSEYRVVRMTRPDGYVYLFSSVEFDDTTVDQIITPASSGSNSFFYLLDSDIDKDGVWDFTMCNYPTWNDAVTYTNLDGLVVVFHDGELYKFIGTSSINDDPSLPASSSEWELYVLENPEDEFTTRYCTCAKIAVLCISTYDCYEQLVKKSFCEIKENFCNDDLLCKSSTFLDTVKLRILIDHIGKAVDNKAWGEVEDAFNLIRNICGCLC